MYKRKLILLSALVAIIYLVPSVYAQTPHETQTHSANHIIYYNCETKEITHGKALEPDCDFGTYSEIIANELSSEGYDGTEPILNTSVSDIFENSVSPATIIGTDDRVRINNPSSYGTERKICYIIAYYDRDGDGKIDSSGKAGTGFLIGPATVMTNAHIVFSKSDFQDSSETAKFCEYVTVAFAKDGSSEPYGKQYSVGIGISSGWTEDTAYTDDGYKHDWAIIDLDDDIGNTIGWFGKKTLTNISTLNSAGGLLTGYPGDKPTGTMWSSTGSVLSITQERITHTFDTYSGSSGSPIYNNTGQVCAINNTSSTNSNGGVAITSTLYWIMDTYRPASLEYTDGKSFRLQNVGTGKYLDVANAADANGTNVIQYSSGNSSNQRFRLQRISAGSQIYRIYAMCSSNGTNRVLDIKRSGDPIAAGQNVQIWTAVDAPAQQWILFEVETGKYRIMPKEGTRYALTSCGSANGSVSGTLPSSAGNVYIEQYDRNNSNQLWRIVDVA